MVDFLVLGYYASDECFFSLFGGGMHLLDCKGKRFFFMQHFSVEIVFKMK